MPELPEVETTRRGIAKHLYGQTIEQVIVRKRQLRWPIPNRLNQRLAGQPIAAIRRRAKYLILETPAGALIIHLGMSGSLRVVATDQAYEKHDHFVLNLVNSKSLRLRDPRRFGAVLWGGQHPDRHTLLKGLGPEPDDKAFNTDYLYRKTRKRRRAIRDVLLDGHIVAGIGNIYANEALFHAGIRPGRASGRISRPHCDKLVTAIKEVIRAAIRAGGSTLRDFQSPEGKPGYFQQTHYVYGRGGQPCRRCGQAIKTRALGGRRAFSCTNCQL